MKSDLVGTLLVLLSAAAFGTIAVMAKLAFNAGATMETILTLRFAVATIAFWTYLAARHQPIAIGRAKVSHFLGLSVIHGIFQLSLFGALARIPASTTVILMYTFPGIVALLSPFLLSERMSRQKVTALVLCLGGTFLVVGNPGGAVDALGIVFGLGAALAYALYVIASSRLFVGVTTEVGIAYLLLFTGAILTSYGAAVGGLNFSLNQQAVALIITLSLGSTVISLATFFAGLRRIGATRAAIISTFEPLMTVILSVTLLTETMTALQWIGGFLILSGVLVLHWPSWPSLVGRKETLDHQHE